MALTGKQALRRAFILPTRNGGTWKGWCAAYVNDVLEITPTGDAVEMLAAANYAQRDPQLGLSGQIAMFGGGSIHGSHVAVALGGNVILSTSGTDFPTEKTNAWAGYNTVSVCTVEEMQAHLGLQFRGYVSYVRGLPLAVSSEQPFAEWQTRMRQYGYTGPINNLPGINTYKAIQRCAAGMGYKGPINGAPGANTWRYFAASVLSQ